MTHLPPPPTHSAVRAEDLHVCRQQCQASSRAGIMFSVVGLLSYWRQEVLISGCTSLNIFVRVSWSPELMFIVNLTIMDRFVWGAIWDSITPSGSKERLKIVYSKSSNNMHTSILKIFINTVGYMFRPTMWPTSGRKKYEWWNVNTVYKLCVPFCWCTYSSEGSRYWGTGGQAFRLSVLS